MTKIDWTAEEVRKAISGFAGYCYSHHGIGSEMIDIAHAFAERIEADGSAVPTCWSLRHKDGTGALFADCAYDNEDDARYDAIALNGESGQLVPVPLFTHPPAQPAVHPIQRMEGPFAGGGIVHQTAQPAQPDCPKCHGTGEVSDSDGLYVGQCTACRAIKQPAQEQPGGKVPEGWARTEAKLHERKTVHEWLNDLHIEREEFGKSLCLLRRLRILCDRYADTCAQLSFEILKQAGWISIAISQPERNATAIYWHMSEHGGFPDIADEWRDEHHLAKASHWMEYASPTPPKADGSKS